MTYDEMYHFAATWGLVLLVVLFSGAITYALWPANRARFNHAANSLLHEDGEIKDD